ncbi:MAG: PaaI family thioesterase [Hyphomicrobiales bacterium]
MADYLSLEDKTGLEFLQALIDQKIQPPMAQLMGFKLVEVSDGRAMFECDVTERFCNPAGVVHGGFAATILDSTLGCCIQTKLPKNTPYGTVELKVNYVRAIPKDLGLVRAIGTTIHVGRRMATSQGRLEDANGKLYAHGSTTCMIY